MDNATLKYVVNRPCYCLAVNSSKNRVYCTLGANITHIPSRMELHNTWMELGSCLSVPFTLLLDAGIEKIQRPKMIGFLLYFQQMAAAEGLGKIVEVLSGSAFARTLHAQIAEMAGTADRRKVFGSYEHAEAWLDL